MVFQSNDTKFSQKKKRQSISSVKHFTENYQNTLWIGFQFHNPKFSQEDVLNRTSTIKVYVQGAL